MLARTGCARGEAAVDRRKAAAQESTARTSPSGDNARMPEARGSDDRAARRLARGRVGRALGFRWVFVLGTLAVPFHPVIARALPWVPVALVTYAVGRAVDGLDSAVTPWTLLLAAALLVVPLSVPVLNHVLLLFRVPLLQGGLVTAAMVLLALDVAAGETAPGWATLPAAYAAWYVVLSIGGRLAVRRMRHLPDPIPVEVAGRGGVEVIGPDGHEAARWLLAHSEVTVVGLDDATWLRPDPAALARARELMAQVKVGYRSEGEVLIVPRAPMVAVTVRERPLRGWLRLLVGENVTVWEVTDGGSVQRLMSGRPEVVGRLPAWVCFYFSGVFGGRSRWVVGFARRREGELGNVAGVLGRLFRERPATPSYADASAALAHLEGVLAERRQRYLRLLDELDHRPPRTLTGPDLADLHNAPAAAVAGTGTALCDLVDRAKEGHGWHLAHSAAIALSRLPTEELLSLTPRLLRITGSRILSLRWRVTPDLDVTPLPRGLPRFGDVGGFGLLERAPQLYERLGELDDPRTLKVVEGLAAEAGWTRALERARDNYLASHPASAG